MNNDDIKKYISTYKINLSQAMQQIDANNGGVLFLVDDDEKLTGCISDGDIRRFLLKGGKLDDPALKAANRSPKFAHDREKAKLLHHEKNYVAIPILDEENRIYDIYTKDSSIILKRASLNIPVVINAGGKGTRLQPFTKVLPKPLILVGDMPIIEHIMQEYQSYNCNSFHIIVNYKKELLKAYFSIENENHYSISWYDEKIFLGTGGGLSLLKGKIHSTFFFTNCDNLLTANYERILQFHRQNKNVITMVCAHKNISIPYGVIEMGINGKIEAIREKPMISFMTNTGTYIVEPEVLNDIEYNTSIGFPDIVELERKKGLNVAVFPVGSSDWMDMGQLSELDKMREKLYGE